MIKNSKSINFPLTIIVALFTCITADAQQKNADPKPLYIDPIYDGAADPVITWNKNEKKWFMFYTNRRANIPDSAGVKWVHGTRIGIAESKDGTTWKYRDTANINYHPDVEYTHWAPEVIENNGLYHMYLTYVPGIFNDWNHPRNIIHLTSKDLLNCEYQSTLKLANDKVIDLKNKTVMPGLIDCHVHLEEETSPHNFENEFKFNPADRAFLSVGYAKTTLMAGFTTVRDVGGSGVNISLRNAVNKDLITGPRIFTAGIALSSTGGHGDPTNGLRDDLRGDPGPRDGVVNGAEECRLAAGAAVGRRGLAAGTHPCVGGCAGTGPRRSGRAAHRMFRYIAHSRRGDPGFLRGVPKPQNAKF